MYNKRLVARKILGVMLFIVVGILLMGYFVMILWNAILPAVIHVSMITFQQALGILILSKILFGGFHRRGWGGGRRMHAMKEKFSSMTPEEREQFKAQWRERCNMWRRKPDSTSTVAE